MKVVVFGSKGMLGTYVCSYISKNIGNENVIKLTRDEYDLNNFTFMNLESFINSLNLPEDTVIINCAGVIPQTKNEKIKEFIKINSLFPVILSTICKYKNWNFIHITTDCVFSGLEGRYDENSEHDETNIYGVSKSLGEIGYGTIIRTSIIGEELTNKRSLLEWIKSNQYGEINGFENHFWNGVTCLQLSKIIFQIIDEKLYWRGTRHIFSPNILSKYELLKMVNEIYDLKIKINKISKNYCDKSIQTNYNSNEYFEIPDLYIQINELRNYNLNK